MASSRRRVAFLQLPLVEHGNGSARANLPLASAYLAQAALDAGLDVDCLFPDQAVVAYGSDAAVLAELSGLEPELLAVTAYLWNVERSLAVAGALKALRPGLAVWFGGPEIQPGLPWLDDGRLDAAFVGPGEAAFAAALARWFAGENPPRLVGCGPAEYGRAADFGRRPSPHAAGLLPLGLDGQALVETRRGCAGRCRYCYYGKALGGRALLDDDALVGFFAWARRSGAREIYLLDPALDQRPDLPDFLARLALLNPEGIPLHAELRAEAAAPAIAAALARAGVRSVEVGLQTVTPAALKTSRRAFDRGRFLAGAAALEAAGLEVRTGLILGLPDDGPAGFAASLEFVAAAGLAAKAEVYPLSVLPGTDFRAQAAAFGLAYSGAPPYSVLASRGWAAEDFYAAAGLVAEILGKELYPAARPDFAAPLAGFARWARPAGLADPGFRFASSLSVFVDRADLDKPSLLDAAARRWRADNRHGVVQLVVAAEGELGPSAAALADRFYDPSHYQERVNLYNPDPQGRFAVRLFQLTRESADVRRLLDRPEPGDPEPIYRLGGAEAAGAESGAAAGASAERSSLARLFADYEPLIAGNAGDFAAAAPVLARHYPGGSEWSIELPAGLA
jgi:hypothetical protein